jgi:hypothetical protein
MHRRLFKHQCEVVAKGGDPVGVAFRRDDNQRQILARSWMVAAGSEELATLGETA